jgi:hypothetical protein
MTHQNTLHLISHQTWQRDELAVASDWVIDHSIGLDVPAYDPKDSWWAPQAQTVQLLNAIRVHGLPELRFIAPTPDLLDKLPYEFTGRKIGTVLAREAVSTLIDWPELWWKLATAKHDKFIAEPRTYEQLLKDVQEHNIPDTAWLQYSEALPEIVSEHRFFVSREKNQHVVQASSGYLKNGVTVYDGAEFTEEETEEAQNLVEELLDSSLSLPPSFVVDIAVTVEGAYILEFNPSWCSGWYDSNVEGVLATIKRGFNSSKQEQKTWGYIPDAVLTQQYLNPGRRVWSPPRVG